MADKTELQEKLDGLSSNLTQAGCGCMALGVLVMSCGLLLVFLWSAVSG